MPLPPEELFTSVAQGMVSNPTSLPSLTIQPERCLLVVLLKCQDANAHRHGQQRHRCCIKWLIDHHDVHFTTTSPRLHIRVKLHSDGHIRTSYAAQALGNMKKSWDASTLQDTGRGDPEAANAVMTLCPVLLTTSAGRGPIWDCGPVQF